MKVILMIFSSGILLAGCASALSEPVWNASQTTMRLEKWNSRPREVRTFHGISIGDRVSDVLFKFGPFNKVDELSSSRTDGNQNDINTYTDEESIGFFERGGTIIQIAYVCKSNEIAKDAFGPPRPETSLSSIQDDYTQILGHRCGDKGDDILLRFSNDVRIVCNEDEDKFGVNWRMYDLVKYGVRYGLTNNRITEFVIRDKTELASSLGRSLGPCAQ